MLMSNQDMQVSPKLFASVSVLSTLLHQRAAMAADSTGFKETHVGIQELTPAKLVNDQYHLNEVAS